MSEGTEKRGVLSAQKRRERAAAELRSNLTKRKALARTKSSETDTGQQAAGRHVPARD